MTERDQPASRRDLRDLRAELEAILTTLATKEDLKAYATKEDLKAYATKEDLKAGFREVRDELRTHFDVVAESFKSEFRHLHDWVDANTNSLAMRVEHIENAHGGRLLSLEGRVTRLEKRRK